MTRPLSILLVIIVLASGFTGCAAPPDSTRPSIPGGTTDNQPRVTISFGAERAEDAFYKPLIAAFHEQNPDIEVVFRPFDDITPDSSQELRAIMSSVDTALLPHLPADAPTEIYLRDLKPFIDADPTFDRDDYYQRLLAPSDAQIYVLPATVEITLLAYNKDLWIAAGLPEPDPAWSWPDLIAAAEQIADPQREIYGIADGADGGTILTGMLTTLNTPILRTVAETGRLDQPELAAVLDTIQELADAGVVYTVAREHDTQNRADAATSASQPVIETLIWEQRLGMWPAYLSPPDSASLAFAIGLTAFPPDPTSFYDQRMGYSMSHGTQHPEAAWRWLAFVSQQRSLPAHPGQYAGAIAVIPARRSLAEQPDVWAHFAPETAATLQRYLDTPAAATPLIDPSIINALQAAYDRMVDEHQPSDQALQAAQAELQEHWLKQPTPDTRPVVVATPVPESIPADAEVITFGVFHGSSEPIERIAQSFHEKHPTIIVVINSELPTASSGEMPSHTDLAAGVDCYVSNPLEAPAALATAHLDLQPLIDADPRFSLTEYAAPLLTPYQHEAGLYGLPYTVDFLVLTYNQAAFDEAGIAPPAPDWTLDDFLLAAQQLTVGEGNAARYGVAFADVKGVALFLTHVQVAAVQRQGDTFQPNFTNPRLLEALQVYLDILRNYSPQKNLLEYRRVSIDSTTFQLVNEGRVGMWFNYVYPSVFADGITFPVAMAAPLLGNKVVSTNYFQSSGMYISATTQHPQACWEWLNYLSSEVGQLETSFPARRSTAESPAFAQQVLPGALTVYQTYSTVLQQPANDDFTSPLPGSEIDYFWFYQAIDRALQGADLEQELARAQTLTEAFLTCTRAGEKPYVCVEQVDPEYDGWQMRPANE